MNHNMSSAIERAGGPGFYSDSQITEMSAKNGFELQGRKVLFVDMLAQCAEDMAKPEDDPLHQSAEMWLALRGPRQDCISFEMFCDMVDMADEVRDRLNTALVTHPQVIALRCQSLDREQDFVRLCDVMAARYEHHDISRRADPDPIWSSGPEEAETQAEEAPASMGMAA